MRIASSSFGTTGWNGQIMDAAFRNPDGSTALVVHNENDNPAPFAVAEGDASFDYTLPGGALATFTWPASGGLDDGLRLVPADPMTATATVGGADAPKAVDDDASTRWATGTAQQPGQTLQVDLGGVVPVRRVVLDTGPDVSDYPRGYAVSTSTDGIAWTPPLVGSGTGQLTRVTVPANAARYVRIVQTATAPQWWSVADLRVYA